MSDAPTRSGDDGSGRQSIWTRPERGSRGPVPAHSRDAIVEAAIALADAEGLPAVSMRAIATALGTGAGSLYRYLSSRDDLLDLMTDRVVGELRPYPPAEGDWLDGMLLLARRQLALHRRHPWLIEVSHRPSAVGPESLAWFDNCLRILEPVACAVTAKFEAIAMVTGVVSLFARSAAAAGSFSFAGADLAAYPHLVAAFSQPPAPAPRADLFERTLRGLLTGLLVADPTEAG
ncbi:TetR/AcrR family transcriptional regulator [Micromonospora acroterricola]|uniref:TetR/AcrR family transcriptional regulator n=1 Tax=Micromonospora acroterricola TaxID=2202421 RepID=A0A317D7L2_9ACTN|nr:helix-turn-helix domain-containing protein [Micromonospora acroterricola]PWR08753.1 TetR/AcrR family transcriptional regulator [Micromonospora acroterricola]